MGNDIKIDLKELICRDAYLKHLDQKRLTWRVLVKMGLKFCVQ